MTATCSCPPDDCHGGHTIDVGPVNVGGPPSLGASRNPMTALHDAIVFNSRDFAEVKFEAWIYGIVVGWDDEDDETGDDGAMDAVAAKVGWTERDVALLRQLRSRWRHIEAAAPALLREVTQ